MPGILPEIMGRGTFVLVIQPRPEQSLPANSF